MDKLEISLAQTTHGHYGQEVAYDIPVSIYTTNSETIIINSPGAGVPNNDRKSRWDILGEYIQQQGIGTFIKYDYPIPDAHWISKYILKRVKPGSVILIHMPEKGVREWNLEAMRLTLDGLLKHNLKVVNLTELQNRLYTSAWAPHEP